MTTLTLLVLVAFGAFGAGLGVGLYLLFVAIQLAGQHTTAAIAAILLDTDSEES